MEIIKSIELLGEFKFDEIYYFYKTSSSEKNLEILSYLKKYQTSMDFFSYFTNADIKKYWTQFFLKQNNILTKFLQISNMILFTKKNYYF